MNMQLEAKFATKQVLDEVFNDHAQLSDFIFNKCGIRETLGELQQMTNSGMCGANDAPVLWLRRMTDAIRDEVRELEESLPWKGWRHEKADIQNVHVELVDLFHFIVSAAQIAGLSGADFIELYYKKRKINFDRQISGFNPHDNKAIVK